MTAQILLSKPIIYLKNNAITITKKNTPPAMPKQNHKNIDALDKNINKIIIKFSTCGL
ncbi:hypothetical protein OMAG_000548 [Candidatus Omnitrophus magneticus]|uniref:Uncharacterized protein n=1 Tax=Candidatus Omnitrophus magneticus TaxID=1609969 RepID=A0A0F0CQH2_9BACT|nr:hypothetical protein OMAG_000548 [Candidatus Omnitrophus magneticus]